MLLSRRRALGTAEVFDPVRSLIDARVSPKALANCCGSWALKKPPRPFTAACSRSSSFAGSLLVGLGQVTDAPFLTAANAVCGSTVPLMPSPTPKVTMCCQNAGSAGSVGTRLSRALCRSRLQ
ncbi:hypothetical protein D3C80_1866990 [compost metagenome]